MTERTNGLGRTAEEQGLKSKERKEYYLYKTGVLFLDASPYLNLVCRNLP